MIDSYFLKLAQKYGLAPIPQTPEQLFQALQGIMTPAQMELVQYLFTDPLQFQSSPFASLATGEDTPPAQAVEPPPSKDRAGDLLVEPGDNSPGSLVTPTPATPATPAQPKTPGDYAPPPGPAPAAGYGGQNNPNNPYAGTNYRYGGSPTVADKANINGVEVWAGGPYAGKPVAQYPQGGDLKPYLSNPSAPAPADASRPYVAPIPPPPAGSVGTPVRVKNKDGTWGWADPGNDTTAPRFSWDKPSS